MSGQCLLCRTVARDLLHWPVRQAYKQAQFTVFFIVMTEIIKGLKGKPIQQAVHASKYRPPHTLVQFLSQQRSVWHLKWYNLYLEICWKLCVLLQIVVLHNFIFFLLKNGGQICRYWKTVSCKLESILCIGIQYRNCEHILTLN